MPAKDIVQMDRRMTARDFSLNAPVSFAEEDSMEFLDTLEDNGPSPESIVVNAQEADVRREYLKEAMKELSDRERHIFVERRLKDDPITLEALGEQYGISRERVRQLENRAFNKVQKAVHNAAFEDQNAEMAV